LVYFDNSSVLILSNNRGLADQWTPHPTPAGVHAFVWIGWLVEKFPYFTPAARNALRLEISSSESRWQNATNKAGRMFVVG
jgi:hypothetical protein